MALCGLSSVCSLRKARRRSHLTIRDHRLDAFEAWKSLRNLRERDCCVKLWNVKVVSQMSGWVKKVGFRT